MRYHTHQVIELPPITMEVTHFLLHQAHCVGCGALLKADIPGQHTTGYGPRLTALIAELGGMHRASRRLVQDFCHSVLHQIFPAHFGERRVISEGYLHSCFVV
jgi:transposase